MTPTDAQLAAELLKEAAYAKECGRPNMARIHKQAAARLFVREEISEALEGTNSLLTAILLERRPDSEIEAQIAANRAVLAAATKEIRQERSMEWKTAAALERMALENERLNDDNESFRADVAKLEVEIERLRDLVECKDCMEYAHRVLAAEEARNDRLHALNAELVEALTDMESYLHYSEQWQDEHPEVSERARAALAKAKGETSPEYK